MEIDTPAAAQALRSHMPTERNLVRKLRFAAFLGRHGFDDGYPFALEHLSEPVYLEAALEAIASIAKPGTAEQLLDIYANSNDSGWKRAAVRGLGLLRHAAFAEELVALTRDREHPLAAAALLARADLGDVDVVELLPAALASRSKAVVIAGARAAVRLLPKGHGQGNQIEEAIRAALATWHVIPTPPKRFAAKRSRRWPLPRTIDWTKCLSPCCATSASSRPIFSPAFANCCAPGR